MRDFLVAQAADPFDPASMLIQADHMEEHGDHSSAEVLRGLAAAGIPSLHVLAIDAVVVSLSTWPDQFDNAFESGSPMLRGNGRGDEFEWYPQPHGSGYSAVEFEYEGLDEDESYDDDLFDRHGHRGCGDADGQFLPDSDVRY